MNNEKIYISSMLGQDITEGPFLDFFEPQT